MWKKDVYVFILLFLAKLVHSSDIIDITDIVFQNLDNAIVAAYGDFNSDELTDVFLLRDDFKTIEILLAADAPPLLRKEREHFRCYYSNLRISSLVPGDFDGDTYMDVMFTATKDNNKDDVGVYINYGESYRLNCTATNDSKPVVVLSKSEPLAIDYNNDMIIDLFGVRKNEEGKDVRSFFIFNKNRTAPEIIDMNDNINDLKLSRLSHPHSHAFLDLNNDSLPDLCLTTETGYEIWHASLDSGFHYNKSIVYPTGNERIYGQSIYLDLELNGGLSQLLPTCEDADCKQSKLWVQAYEHYNDLDINFFRDDDNKTQWGFLTPKEDGKFYEKAITLRVGDFNNDGYPDLLATLEKKNGERAIQTFLLENVKNTNVKGSNKFKRTFVIRWNALERISEPNAVNFVMGSFYDFNSDGILDVIFQQKIGDKYKPIAFRNSLDYDANFIKVIVLTGLDNPQRPKKETHPFGAKSRSYGTNLPGPKIRYNTTTQEGEQQHGLSTQLPQSAYFALHLPYQIFGLGRTPNFVDFVDIGLAGKTKSYEQIIPNSQIQIIPKDPFNPSTWKAQLFVTPSKVIIKSVIALLGICLVILIIICILHIKERREDKLEKLQEAQRFHFDAM
ncbi:hypothetical protein PVAND_012297 [Polypedilum vanderplanki]|uniref:T-cell immunomodulatory protein TIP C2 domain-containing protein n=1 Tax=Polypedilum vanderplanki TaxID=319348 RepID=A0A9J6CMA5_POLVA|nr:hypothetical protein PVAND_012297 [Polypedilum vanderplanki]